ncbi:MAG: hypothetical protein HQL66_14695, partial [Magnetococcales bacterium]|nr:hypothetical protein [Magnetococcales bacterium]
MKTGGHLRLYFPRWRFPYNLGDTVMLSSVFAALRQVYRPNFFEVVADATVAEVFAGDPWVDRFSVATWLERKLIRHPLWNWQRRRRGDLLLWPHWQPATFAHLATSDHLERLIADPRRNILSVNYAIQLGPGVLDYPDLRPRLYLTPAEVEQGRAAIAANAIALHIAPIRRDQGRHDGERLRYRRASWQRCVDLLRAFDPTLTFHEVGQERFEGIGDHWVAPGSIRALAAKLKAMRLVILADGGVHNLCNAIDQPVLLFQGYEWNPPELFKMGNALFDPTYHPACRRDCHLFEEILNLPRARDHCQRACYDLDPERLAADAIAWLRGQPDQIV